MSAIEEIRAERLRKLALLTEKGINPYPAVTKRTHHVAEVVAGFDTFVAQGTEVTLAGRLMIVRGQGAILFADIFENGSKFQAVFKSDVMAEDTFSLFKEVIDNGDFIEVTGTIFATDKGQQSILVRE